MIEIAHFTAQKFVVQIIRCSFDGVMLDAFITKCRTTHRLLYGGQGSLRLLPRGEIIAQIFHTFTLTELGLERLRKVHSMTGRRWRWWWYLCVSVLVQGVSFFALSYRNRGSLSRFPPWFFEGHTSSFSMAMAFATSLRNIASFFTPVP